MTSTDIALTRFWADARALHPSLPAELPEAWAFGATPEHADGLLTLVLEGTKTATASSLGDYEDDAEPLPSVGDLSIILDGAEVPRAVLEVTAIDIVPFDEVTAEHARAEGEDDRSLASWRRIHETFWREYSARGFATDMPVVCERFRVLHAPPPERD
ncbi:MAG: ASCH domain-containing protein [Brachybacterium sp.]|uniref:ASCH domain-containing protein n=1 Tax=Brachybacterium sp. TaxID=1891286 RepID=UPI002649BADE|nr:ASCH domain-containing protein [Brachybacterium sp.]MDN5685310.1 ASCH domain-containing protein [Brachybacterium sp.]